MKHLSTNTARGKFKHLAETAAAQVLLMTLGPGEASDDQPSNEHPKCEQWMYVMAGSGEVLSSTRRKFKIGPGSLVVIEKRELHQIRATGKAPLRTLNFYIPPAYARGAKLRPRAK
jgi:mannose-6-phosphate isomerase-like protein (cupin superfamily)